MRLIAIDWSGSRELAAQRKHIWMADWNDGRVTLTNNRSRDETVHAVISSLEHGGEIVVGFDFAFGFPDWFTHGMGCASAVELWERVAQQGESWLNRCSTPFWGRPGKPCPSDHGEPSWLGRRWTEEDVRQRTGHRPKSPFQIGGAGAVGTGSIRGMPILKTLREAGFCIWPFHAACRATVIEIYPRLSVGKTRVSNGAERRAFIYSERFHRMPDEVREKACAFADAFDALCALRDMIDHQEELKQLSQATEERRLLEGEIWLPPQM
jgi:Protein of unknown function (DUF429)